MADQPKRKVGAPKKEKTAEGSLKPKTLWKQQGNRLGTIRDQLKLSQQQLGDKFGKSQTMIQRYEAGIAKVPAELWIMLNKEYDVSIEWANLGKGNKKSGPEDKKLIVEIGKLQEQNRALETRVQLLEHYLKLIFDNVPELQIFNEKI